MHGWLNCRFRPNSSTNPFVRLPNRTKISLLPFLFAPVLSFFFFSFRLFQPTIRGGTIAFLGFLGVDGERDIIRDNVIALFVDSGCLMFDFFRRFFSGDIIVQM